MAIISIVHFNNFGLQWTMKVIFAAFNSNNVLCIFYIESDKTEELCPVCGEVRTVEQ